MKCPMCDGRGSSQGFYDGPTSSGYGNLKCSQCSGSGEVPDVMADWIRDGKALRHERIRRGETIFQVAKRTGMTLAQVSAMERGRIEPDHEALKP